MITTFLTKKRFRVGWLLATMFLWPLESCQKQDFGWTPMDSALLIIMLDQRKVQQEAKLDLCVHHGQQQDGNSLQIE